jgi:hypothetical protein
MEVEAIAREGVIADGTNPLGAQEFELQAAHAANMASAADEACERLLISAASMDMMQTGLLGEGEIRDYEALMDSGANVVVAPVCLAQYLGLPITSNRDGRTIGTADSDAALTIVGWIFPEGYTGAIALVRGAAFILIAVNQLQRHGMGVCFPAFSMVCRLTVTVDGQEEAFEELKPKKPTNLYFIDIRRLLTASKPVFVSQPNDYSGAGPKAYGGKAYIDKPQQVDGFITYTASNGTILPVSSRKKKPTSDMLYRVWHLHECMQHTSLTTLAGMSRQGSLQNAKCTEKEMLLVRDHQDCLACATAKWKKLTMTPSSGITPNLVGAHRSCYIKSNMRLASCYIKFIFYERSVG